MNAVRERRGAGKMIEETMLRLVDKFARISGSFVELVSHSLQMALGNDTKVFPLLSFLLVHVLWQSPKPLLPPRRPPFPPSAETLHKRCCG